MTIDQLKKAIASLPDEMEIIVHPDLTEHSVHTDLHGDFTLRTIKVEVEPDTGEEFADFVCDQNFDDEG